MSSFDLLCSKVAERLIHSSIDISPVKEKSEKSAVAMVGRLSKEALLEKISRTEREMEMFFANIDRKSTHGLG